MNVWPLILYSILMFLTMFVAGLIPLFAKAENDKLLKLFASLGAGLLLGMAFLHMLPEASERIPETFGFWFLAGFTLLLILERFLMVHTCDEGHCDYHTVGIAAFVGITIHATIEGFALASALFVSTIGHAVLLAILIHKAPTALALTSILKLAGKTKKQIILFITGIALSSPLGVFIAYFALETTADVSHVAGILLALSAGTFLYIAACDLLPELHKTSGEKGKRLAFFLVGIGITLLGFVHPHH